jgi:SAM-dependent methyltransferase
MGTSQAVPAQTGAFTYDGFGWFYDRFWGGAYHDAVLDLMRKVLFPALPPAAGILDLCCGTGHLTRLLAGYGYRLTGIDNSRDMLDYARHNVPEANFLLADARSFQFAPRFHAAVSTFDSLNHLLAPEDLLQASAASTPAFLMAAISSST